MSPVREPLSARYTSENFQPEFGTTAVFTIVLTSSRAVFFSSYQRVRPKLLAEQVMGRTRTNRPVFLDGDISELRGKLVKAKITECRPWSLTGVRQGEPY